MEEGGKLARITRTAKNPVRMRRAIMVMMSAQGQTVRDITSLLQVSDDYLRDVIHAFNERGFDALDPKPSGGRPRKIGEQIRWWICAIARTPPPTGVSPRSRPGRCPSCVSTCWARASWRRSAARRTGASCAPRGVLADDQTWKASTDPDFIAKMRRVLTLYDHPPADGRVVCVDEFGPLNLLPRNGKAWRSYCRPRRLRATTPVPLGLCTSSPRWTWPPADCLPDPNPQALHRVPRPAQRSKPGPITRPRLRDKPLVVLC